MKAFVVLNSHAGGFTSASAQRQREEIAAKLASAGIDAAIALARRGATAPLVHAALKARTQGSQPFDMVIVGGGDGTVNAAASVLAGQPLPLGVLPLGTFNHFARDLGLPLDLDAAIGVIAKGHTRRVDVGEVNGRVFVNNSSLGLYPAFVVERERVRRFGLAKSLAAALALLRVLWRLPSPWLQVSAEGWKTARRTPCLFVGNNFYAVDVLAVGRRAELDRGELCLYIVSQQSRMTLLGLAARSLLGRLDLGRDATAARLTAAEVSSPRRRLRVALDGQSLRLRPPLQYRIRPRALEVVAPAP